MIIKAKPPEGGQRDASPTRSEETRATGRITRVKITQSVEVPYLNVKLANGMSLFISDSGPTITVRDPGGEVSPGLFSPAGEYEITLPSASEIGEKCSGRESGDYDSPGTATISVTHRH